MKEVIEGQALLKALRRCITKIQKRYPPKDGEIAWSLTTLEGYLAHVEAEPAEKTETLELFGRSEK